MFILAKFVYFSTLWMALIQCSPQTEEGEERILMGKLAHTGQIPWQVSLNTIITGEDYLICGGSLISDRWVITAVHCLFDPDIGLNASAGDVTITAGSLSPAVFDDGQQFTGQKIILHPKYDNKLIGNDIALIWLDKPIKTDENTSVIQLGSEHVENGTTVYASGWGSTREGDDAESLLLLYVDLKTISNDECGNAFKGKPVIGGETICTRGQGGKNICKGDSGGPLFMKTDNGENVLVGITSLVWRYCSENMPSLFTRISYYRDWIKENTGI